MTFPDRSLRAATLLVALAFSACLAPSGDDVTPPGGDDVVLRDGVLARVDDATCRRLTASPAPGTACEGDWGCVDEAESVFASCVDGALLYGGNIESVRDRPGVPCDTLGREYERDGACVRERICEDRPEGRLARQRVTCAIAEPPARDPAAPWTLDDRESLEQIYAAGAQGGDACTGDFIGMIDHHHTPRVPRGPYDEFNGVQLLVWCDEGALHIAVQWGY